MKPAFRWLLAHFAGGFLIVLIVQVAVVGLGMRIALSGYARNQQDTFEQIARLVLLNGTPDIRESLSYTNPFFVYSTDGSLIFSNRGRGRSIAPDELQPVREDGSIIGYFHAGQMRFTDNEANRVFLTTLLLLAGASLIAFAAIGTVVSVIASRRIAGAVSLLRSDIQSIESRNAVKAKEFMITELSQISNSLEKLSNLLADEENYKRQWMQDIAHDLRTPISGLKGQLEGMRDGVLDPTKERLERNLTEVDRLQNLVSGISELYRVENTDTIDSKEFASADFVEELLAPHEIAKNEKRITVNVSIETDSIRGDRHLLLRAVGNIVSNAFSYSDAEGTIEISVRKDHGTIRIEITDTGPGIPPDQSEKIFHRFFRGDYARNSTGTGLGLNIAKAIIARHGGDISFENRLPRGARFVISLP